MNSVFCYIPENQRFNLKCSIGEFIRKKQKVLVNSSPQNSEIRSVYKKKQAPLVLHKPLKWN